MDMWAIACTIYELFAGTILFQGRDNNEMLRLIMDLKGPFPKKMVKKGVFSHLHFAGVLRVFFCSCFAASGQPSAVAETHHALLHS